MPRPSRLSLDLLETFVAVMEQEGDASRASSFLGINQPSMSKRLSQLQNAGGAFRAPWLQRRGKRWGLTDEGQRVLPAVEELVRRYRALGEFAGASSSGNSVVSFACGRQVVEGLALQALLDFHRERPEDQVRITTIRGRSRIEGVACGHLDLATVTHAESEIHRIARRKLHVETLRDDPFVLVASQSGPEPWREVFEATGNEPLTDSVLERLPLILPEVDSGVRLILDRCFERSGLAERLTIALEVGGWSAILAYVRAGVGVGIVPESMIGLSLRLLSPRRLDPETFPPMRLNLICRTMPLVGEKLDLSESASGFRDCLIRVARN